MPNNRSVEIFAYNAFAEEPFAGNPAGVVLDASGLAEAEMAGIARQMNLSETAFLMEPSQPGADIRLRWFTPAQEVKLCGHATIAAFCATVEHGIFPVDEGDERIIDVETLSGQLRVRISRRQGQPQVGMQIPLPEFDELETDRAGFATIWGVDPDELTGPWQRHSDPDYWYVGVRDRAALAKLRLDTAPLAELDPQASFAFFTADTVDADSHWHLRFFAPFLGVPEDPVTGSAQGPMGVIHHRLQEEEAADGWSEFQGEQGDLLDRPGRVRVRLLHEAGTLEDLEICGGARRMLEGRMNL